jgi:hypothetical protein
MYLGSSASGCSAKAASSTEMGALTTPQPISSGVSSRAPRGRAGRCMSFPKDGLKGLLIWAGLSDFFGCDQMS